VALLGYPRSYAAWLALQTIRLWLSSNADSVRLAPVLVVVVIIILIMIVQMVKRILVVVIIVLVAEVVAVLIIVFFSVVIVVIFTVKLTRYRCLEMNKITRKHVCYVCSF
jgi:hypothetical protein